MHKKHQHKKHQPHKQGQVPLKKNYQSPELVNFGNVVGLVAAGGATGPDGLTSLITC